VAAIAWDARMSVGSSVIDAQHRKLIELIAELEEAIRKGEGKSRVEAVLRELERYVAIHLTYEEALLERNGFPGLAAHRAQHDYMRGQVTKVRRQATAGSADAGELLGFLMLWLKGHIEAEDRAYAEFMQSRGVKAD
jgi:hemerythrin-like metal-binding protein